MSYEAAGWRGQTPVTSGQDLRAEEPRQSSQQSGSSREARAGGEGPDAWV